jgi:type IV pilus assembly protein PilB
MSNYQFMKLGDILVEENIISQEQLEKALSEQKITRDKLGTVLINHGAITEEDLVQAYSLQLGHPQISEDDMLKAPIEVVSLIPENFAKENHVIALNQSNDILVIAMENPDDLDILDEIKKLTGLSTDVRIAGRSSIKSAINTIYDKIRQKDEVQSAISNIDTIDDEDKSQNELDLGDEEVSPEDAPIVKLVNLILMEAIKENSSDIHIEAGRDEVSVRIRIDGVLAKIMSPPIASLNGIMTRIKILSKLNIAEHRVPQDGRMKIKTKERDIDVRVSILPTIHGEKCVLRLLGSGEKAMTLTDLGFPKNKLKTFKKWINQPYGMVLMCGPTGSGKSTTLYAALQEINSEDINITTVEDPVEYQLAGINQVQMHEEIGLTFASSLRSILRQDPDVLLIGEIRDEETAGIAVKFSLTGHLVFSTVHANDAINAITRLLDIGIPPFLLGSCANLIVAQRLIRTICKNCKEEYTPNQTELEMIGLSQDKANSITFFHGKGCRECRETGYKGRTAIDEILELKQNIKNLIFEGANEDTIKVEALKQGMTPLREAGIEKIEEGVTTIQEVIRSTVQE